MKTMRRRDPYPSRVPPRSQPRLPNRPPPRTAHGGIKAQSSHGEFGKSWWARRWQAVLESFRFGGRLARGKTYARQGQVLSIDIVEGVVKAQVQGSRNKPYDVTIKVNMLTPAEWAAVVKALTTQAMFVAKLLAGEMPEQIEQVFDQAKVSLFPRKRGDLQTKCNCPDETNPCKHIAAVYFLLGEEFDRDPFLLFRLRGLKREALFAKLGPSAKNAIIESASMSGPAPELPPPPPEPLPLDPSAFWHSKALPEDFCGEVQIPPVSAGLIRQLGKFPFWRGARPLVEALEPTYLQASPVGLATFLGDKGED
jgi:uncharacterized Zn finger protein